MKSIVTTFIICACAVMAASCKKEQEETPNVQVTVSIPDSLYYENKIYVGIQKNTTGFSEQMDTTVNGGTVAFYVEPGNYLVSGWSATNDTTTIYSRAQSGAPYEYIAVAENGVTTVDLDAWCEFNAQGIMTKCE